MKCPICGFLESKVIDSRPASEGASIRRRRECLSCQKRFTTYELLETLPLTVIKKDKKHERFDRTKLLGSIMRACDKTTVSREEMDRITSEIETQLQNSLNSEVASSYIGELVMEKLKSVDEVAYIRFTSVYRQFKDIADFMEELNKLKSEK